MIFITSKYILLENKTILFLCLIVILKLKIQHLKLVNKNKVIDLNLKIEKPGEIVCLLGPSGVGKTTILRSIAGLQKISKGEIFLNNRLISSSNTHIEPEKRNIALSFQDNSLFPHYNVIDNINFGSKRNSEKNSFNSKELIDILHLNSLEKISTPNKCWRGSKSVLSQIIDL